MSNTSVSCIAVWQLFGSLKDDADSAVSSFPTDHPKLLLFVLMFTSMISQGFQVTTSQGLCAHELEYLNYFLGFFNMGVPVALSLLVGVLSHI